MSPRPAEGVAFLRRAIAALEAHGPSQAPPAKLALTPALDRMLGGGLAGDALHEIAPAAPGDGAAATGFGLALAARFLEAPRSSGLLVAQDFAAQDMGALYGPGLVAHGLPLSRLVFARAPDAPALLWAMEEALKSGGLAVVLGELWNLKPYSLAASRRLVLAARAGGTPALLVQAGAYGRAGDISSAAETRFEIASAPSARLKAAGGRDLPGPPAFAARLVKARWRSDAQDLGAQGFDQGKVFRVQWDGDERRFSDPAISLDLVDAAGQRSRA